MKYCLLFFLLTGLTTRAWCDQPPSWKEFAVKSANAKFEASVAKTGASADLQPHARQFRIRVRASGSKLSRPLWEGPYHYDGYEGGELSNDGAYFAHVDFWYWHSHPALQIYSKGRSCSITGEQLGIDESRLQRTVSHRLWLNGEPAFVETDGKTVALRVPTVQGDKQIDLLPKVSYNGAALQCDQQKPG